jgi:hypothetical protein
MIEIVAVLLAFLSISIFLTHATGPKPHAFLV